MVFRGAASVGRVSVRGAHWGRFDGDIPMVVASEYGGRPLSWYPSRSHLPHCAT